MILKMKLPDSSFTISRGRDEYKRFSLGKESSVCYINEMNDSDYIDLPVRSVLPELAAALCAHAGAVLAAAPGAGKTTLVPPALLDGFDGGIILLEPRRVAARAAARRIASLLGEPVGKRVGYVVRGESRIGPETRITVMTGGVLLRRLQRDPELAEVSLVIFDEFHERSLDADLGLAFALDVQENLRPDLKLLVMSATLETERVASLLGGVPVIEAPGRQFPVEIRYGAGGLDRSRPEPETVRAVSRLYREIEGDLLVFLPGMREIETCAGMLKEALPEEALLLKLHGSLGAAEQDLALAPAPFGRRKVVLSTNVAESSITIDGVTGVVDSGLERHLRFDPAAGFSFLEVMPISKASAAQRSGRAGRTRPGVAVRLWNAVEERSRSERTQPEILEADLAPLVLETAAWGTNAESLRWLDPPPAAALSAARRVLAELGAVSGEGRITERGRRLAELPVHPRLAAMLLAARERGIAPLGCELAAILEERDAYRWFDGADLRERIRRMRSNPGAFRQQHVIRRQLLELLREKDRVCDVEESGLLVAVAFPEWIGRARTRHGRSYRLSGGPGAVLAEGDDLCGHEFLAVARLSGGGREPAIRLAAPVDPEMLFDVFADRLHEVDRVEFDPDRERALARRESRFGAIVLTSTPLENPPREALAEAVLAAAQSRSLELPPPEAKSARALFDRVGFAHRQEPESYPDWSGNFAGEAAPFLGNVRSFADLRKLDWNEILRNMLGFNLLHELDASYPEAFTTPVGARHRIDYGNEQPTLSAKVQEFYGVTVHPVVGHKRIPLRIELLSPALRPVQVTTDLPGFWRGSWELVRKEMKSRYPKHLWPEDPASEKPTLRSVKPKKS